MRGFTATIPAILAVAILFSANDASARAFIGGGVVIGSPYYYYPPYYAYYPPPYPYPPAYPPSAYPYPPPSGAVPPPPSASDNYYTSGGEDCREYHRDIIIEGRRQEAFGRACRQPDGSWKIVD